MARRRTGNTDLPRLTYYAQPVSEQSTTIEDRIRLAHDAQDFDEAITILLRGYGPEILGFLVARLRDENAGSEAFSIFCEDLLRGLPKFAWRASARAWAYAIARNAANRWATAPHRRAERNVALSQAGALGDVAEKVRTTTLLHLRSEVKDRFTQLREQLSQEDQTVLILRVDKKMSWSDLASVLLYADDAVEDEAALKREAARVRKRFQLIKEKLRKLAQAEGLLPDE